MTKLFVIGDLNRLPDGPRQAIQRRRTRDPSEASAAVAVASADGTWPAADWHALRRAFQDHGLAVFGTWVDQGGCSRCPRKPWPGSAWAFPEVRHNVGWYRLCRDPTGYDPGDTRIL